jgi:hypothetical protein
MLCERRCRLTGLGLFAEELFYAQLGEASGEVEQGKEYCVSTTDMAEPLDQYS